MVHVIHGLNVDVAQVEMDFCEMVGWRDGGILQWLEGHGTELGVLDLRAACCVFFFAFSVRCIIYRCCLGRSQLVFFSIWKKLGGCKDLRVFFGQTPDAPEILSIFSFECAPIGKKGSKNGPILQEIFFRV